MKSNTVYKRAYNRCLELIADRAVATVLPSEADLARRLDVSRTTVRAVLRALTDAGLAEAVGPHRVLARRPEASDRFPEPQTESVGAAVERQFMEWTLQGDFRAGQSINCAELARKFATSTTAIREYLTHFQHFGLVERRPNSSWVFKGVTTDFAAEIYEIREMFEIRSAHRFAELAPDHPAWGELAAIEEAHRLLLDHIDIRYREFSRLDERLHRLIHEASRNRFIQNFHDVISMIFHYHYQWNKADERERNTAAVHEHLAYIAALRSCDRAAIDAACRAHLKTARATLLRSIDAGPFKTG
ncbi:GntR family transcriptional regulator [Siculibacillus lacustris]|uniref:GntR family transcriptional regulator n=1 Tax=Siculibacillus lacustris TaxID=1549641 RepID=A0A4Q9VWI2_9HYPH|nr:GntR family transcriptional regulator [Siculibacillus lacustris]TBW40679.1 GntR family transcriptional regulator [Siculibacillus lacustris]